MRGEKKRREFDAFKLADLIERFQGFPVDREDDLLGLEVQKAADHIA